ncbi:MAG: sigma-54 dependent transcriptional regulator [Patescibacteria group bacterium]
MARILISWVATNNDFLEGKGKPNPDGPSCIVHKHFYDYDYHLLLSGKRNKDSDLSFEFLVNHLKREYQHEIREQFMNLNDVIDLKEIKAKVEKLLLEHRKDEIEIYISPGTSTMQVAWYFAHLELGLKTKLFQTRPGKFTKTKLPEKLYIDLERSNITSSLIIKEELVNKPTDGKLKITNSIKPVYKMAEKVAAADNVTVLILGETGTGKEGLARFIHENSPRSKGPFIPLNCAAMGESLLESRLFGYAKGAHNVAFKDKTGLFEDANGGTVFLDEIGDISPYMQQSLLRVLQEKEITRVGESKPKKVDVRVIAATNRNLLQMCKETLFRFDLYYRLSVVDLTLPPLRDRGIKEIEEIFEFILKKKKEEFNQPVPKFSKEIKKKLFSYSFPGNIRELENLIEKIYATVEGEVNDKSLPNVFYELENEYSLKLIDVENNHIKKVLATCNNNLAQTSRVLGIARNTLDKRIKEFDLLN